MTTKTRHQLMDAYKRMYKTIGPRNWWPGDTTFEIIVGAILTQNTAWRNVAKAIQNLKDKELLTPAKLNALPIKKLASIIRPAGYYNIKAVRLKNFLNFLFSKYSGKITKMFKTPLPKLRKELLEVNGVGPETADSILLYAGGLPIFVIDAYTKRIFFRHNLIDENCDYHKLQGIFMKHLPCDSQLFNEYHALLVWVGHHLCKRTPKCEECPLQGIEFKKID